MTDAPLRKRRWLKVSGWILGLVGASCCGGWFAVVPWRPFQEPAGPLDALVPRDVDAAARFSLPDLDGAPALARLRADPVFAGLLEDVGLGPDDDALTAAMVGMVGDDVVLASRDDELLGVIRIEGAWHATAIGVGRLAAQQAGATIRQDGDVEVWSIGHRPDLHVAQHRDVLLVSEDRDLLDGALELAQGGQRGLASAPGYDDALAAATPAGATVRVWSTGEWAEDLVDWALILTDTDTGPLAELLDPERFGPTRMEFAFTPQGCDLNVSWRFRGGVPERLARAQRLGPEALTSAQAAARGLSGAAEEIGSGAVAMRAVDLLDELDVPDELTEPLRRRAGDLAAVVGLAWFRRADADELAQASQADDGKAPAAVEVAVIPIPAVAGESSANVIRERLRERGFDEVPVGNATLHTTPDAAGDAPAMALTSTEVVLSSSRVHLLQALSDAPGAVQPTEPRGDGQALRFRLDGAQLARQWNDSRFVAERRAIARADRFSAHSLRVRLSVELGREGMKGAELRAEVKRRVEAEMERVRERAGPDAQADHELTRRRIALLRSAWGTLGVAGDRGRLHVALSLN